MITVIVEKDKEKISLISIMGHSGYDESGKDIVCSAVSTATILTVNLIEKLSLKYEFVEDENNTSMKIINLDTSDLMQNILENLVYNLKQIAKDYKKFVKIKEIRR